MAFSIAFLASPSDSLAHMLPPNKTQTPQSTSPPLRAPSALDTPPQASVPQAQRVGVAQSKEGEV
ncbi:hypothetical protein PILCRDRAFT_821768 [Piloderma croceum F 1598]|uniref:Uncharacterized protein n=1 Tax=Piloderma croceum (strain F 1598) TaxID=765440 RepID=A0A0C3F9G8_PILCF|nr:hypothetical protein PILCRDRAFT_821768 [Piloderma croceum F 1598]